MWPFKPVDSITIRTRRIQRSDGLRVSDRQELINGFDQRALEMATVNEIGAGGIGSEIGEGLVRKGIGRLRLFDHDPADITNLNRQLLFRSDIGKPKGLQVARNLALHATGETIIQGYALSFQDAVALGIDMNASVVVCGVDNGQTRVAVAGYFRKLGIPVIFIAVDLAAQTGYVAVQEASGPCFGCFFPKNPWGGKAPCRAPASKDILKVMAGLALYAIDSLLMNRKRAWNFRQIHLAGFAPDIQLNIARNGNCPLCGPSADV